MESLQLGRPDRTMYNLQVERLESRRVCSSLPLVSLACEVADSITAAVAPSTHIQAPTAVLPVKGDLVGPQQGMVVGDFNLDGEVDASDIDMLGEVIRQGGDPNPLYDLTNDGLVDGNDMDHLVRNILGTEYGDANLDQVVNSLDFAEWAHRRFQFDTGWAAGDFNYDGLTDGRDFVIWNAHKGVGQLPETAASTRRAHGNGQQDHGPAIGEVAPSVRALRRWR